MQSNQRRGFLKTSMGVSAVVATGGLLAACGGGDDHGATPAPAPTARNIVQLAQATPDLSILVEAVVAADLAGTLSGTGPFTVFAPSNAAFAALLTELGVTKQQLLDNKPLLTSVLTYHVLGANVKKAGIPLGKAIDPVLTGTKDIFKIDAVGNDVIITDGRNRTSKITATDIEATNGVVHLIDKVILPANRNIVQTAQSISDFSILVEAVVAAGLANALSGEGPFTVFAPTNAAFAALLTELNVTKDALLANTALLTSVLQYHVVPARVLKADVPVGQPVSTLLTGNTFSVNASLQITDGRNRSARITSTDVLTSNGVIHVIDRVILPRA
jgi:uncharacterized surface protein with fasciclin (FAS1) repeats